MAVSLAGIKPYSSKNSSVCNSSLFGYFNHLRVGQCLLFVCLLTLTLAAGPVAAQDTAIPIAADNQSAAVEDGSPAATAHAPKFILVAFSPDDGPNQVSIVFSRQISKSDLTRLINELGRKAGWHIWGLEVKAEKAKDEEARTSASFLCDGIINRHTGMLGIEPLIETFASEGSFRALFLAPGMEVKGPADFSGGEITVTFLPKGDVYEYEVVVGPQTPALYDSEGASSSGEAGLAEKKLPAGAILAVFVSVGLVVGWLWYGRKKKSQ